MTGDGSLTEAAALLEEIGRLARASDYPELLKIDADPRAHSLLGLLPDAQTREAEVHLEGARIWRSGQIEKARGKLEAASKALDDLDVVLARGILRKIDATLLGDSEMALYDELSLAVEARAVELEDLEKDLPSFPPDSKRRRGRGFRRR